jgi:hypothetical protein
MHENSNQKEICKLWNTFELLLKQWVKKYLFCWEYFINFDSKIRFELKKICNYWCIDIRTVFSIWWANEQKLNQI